MLSQPVASEQKQSATRPLILNHEAKEVATVLERALEALEKHASTDAQGAHCCAIATLSEALGLLRDPRERESEALEGRYSIQQRAHRRGDGHGEDRKGEGAGL